MTITIPQLQLLTNLRMVERVLKVYCELDGIAGYAATCRQRLDPWFVGCVCRWKTSLPDRPKLADSNNIPPKSTIVALLPCQTSITTIQATTQKQTQPPDHPLLHSVRHLFNLSANKFIPFIDRQH